ncbi:MAG: M50 family metallopeptidase [Polyangiales bacterium]
MSNLFANASQIVISILGLSLLVIVHETGHYLAARLFGMKVLRYSIGIGPTIAKWQPKNSPTVFQVCLIPALAYVQIAGMNPFEENDRDDPTLFPNKGLLARAITIAAGPFANYAFASLLIFGTAVIGWPRYPVGEVNPDQPAAAAGMKTGDIFVRANGSPTLDWQDLVQNTSDRVGQPTEYTVERQGKLLHFTITPTLYKGRGVIGVVRGDKPVVRPLELSAAARAAVVLPYTMTVLHIKSMGELFRKPSTDNLVGPIGMGKLLSKQYERGLLDYITLLVTISVLLGAFNLFPFPALDGGRLLFLGYEFVTRRKPNERIEAIVHTVGIVVLLGLFVTVTAREVREMFWG